ncbi:F-box domain protein [Annulohypoxylon bovei var. microspora]|nr:F-box domain protein [Annulohypoxylon bovei var. microspora]
MATPTLTDLPTELLDEIISQVLPEGFESLALTCRGIYELCTPFIERHNQLRLEFQNFRYREQVVNGFEPARVAFDLITRIAVEPIVARYIKNANFDRDNYPPRLRRSPLVPDIHLSGPVVALFANSPYLKQAGLDWKEYYGQIKEDVERHPRYSQHLAAFILTLLPNLKALRLPKLWRPLEKPDKLLNAIVRETKRSTFPWDRPSLSQVTRFEISSFWDAGHRFELDRAVPFLALPHVRSFRSPCSVAIGNNSVPLASQYPYLCYGETLETAHLEACCMDEIAIADFLKHTPRLKTLRYSYSTVLSNIPQDWDICKFVTAIEREAGSHLEELHLSIFELNGSLTPGKASMRGFQRLGKLEFPLEIAMCNITDAASRFSTANEGVTDQEIDRPGPFIGDLVPASVSQLSLLSRGKDHHENALKVMFSNFATKKDAQLPALKDIHLSCPRNPSADDAYKKECAKLMEEIGKTDVVLHLVECPFSNTTRWRQHVTLPFS